MWLLPFCSLRRSNFGKPRSRALHTTAAEAGDERSVDDAAQEIVEQGEALLLLLREPVQDVRCACSIPALKCSCHADAACSGLPAAWLATLLGCPLRPVLCTVARASSWLGLCLWACCMLLSVERAAASRGGSAAAPLPRPLLASTRQAPSA